MDEPHVFCVLLPQSTVVVLMSEVCWVEISKFQRLWSPSRTMFNLPACLPVHYCVLLKNRERFAERIGNVAEKVEHCDLHFNHGAGTSVSGYLVADSATSKPKEESAISKTTHGR